MYRKLLIISLFIYSFTARSQELLNLISPEDEELLIDDQEIVLGNPLEEDELENLEILRGRDEETLNNILNSKFNKYDERQKEIVEIQIKDILKSKLFKGYINKGTMLYNLVKKKQEVLTQNVYVKAYSLTDIEDYHLIQNENGTVTYKVRSSEIAHIENISDLHEPPTKFKPVTQKEVFTQLDSEDIKIMPELLYHTGITRPELMRDLTNDKNHTGTITKVELRALGQFAIPVRVGLSAYYSNTQANVGTGGENYKIDSFAIGPVLQIPHVMEELIDININASFHSTLFANVVERRLGETLNYRLSQSMLTLGIEKEIKFLIGKFIVGGNFQRQWGRASSDEFNIDVDNESNFDDNYTLVFGWGFDWDI